MNPASFEFVLYCTVLTCAWCPPVALIPARVPAQAKVLRLHPPTLWSNRGIVTDTVLESDTGSAVLHAEQGCAEAGDPRAWHGTAVLEQRRRRNETRVTTDGQTLMASLMRLFFN